MSKKREKIQKIHRLDVPWLSEYSLSGDVDTIIENLNKVKDVGKEALLDLDLSPDDEKWSVSIDIDVGIGYYDSVEVDVTACLSRFETDYEYNQRIEKLNALNKKRRKEEKDRKKQQEKEELAELARLKAKYEGVK